MWQEYCFGTITRSHQGRRFLPGWPSLLRKEAKHLRSSSAGSIRKREEAALCTSFENWQYFKSSSPPCLLHWREATFRRCGFHVCPKFTRISHLHGAQSSEWHSEISLCLGRLVR